jgi:hypothetical protein
MGNIFSSMIGGVNYWAGNLSLLDLDLFSSQLWEKYNESSKIPWLFSLVLHTHTYTHTSASAWLRPIILFQLLTLCSTWYECLPTVCIHGNYNKFTSLSLSLSLSHTHTHTHTHTHIYRRTALPGFPLDPFA